MNQENGPDGNRPNVSPVKESSRGARTLTVVVKALLLLGFLVVTFALKFKTWRNLLPLSTFGLMFGLFLFGNEGNEGQSPISATRVKDIGLRPDSGRSV